MNKKRAIHLVLVILLGSLLLGCASTPFPSMDEDPKLIYPVDDGVYKTGGVDVFAKEFLWNTVRNALEYDVLINEEIVVGTVTHPTNEYTNSGRVDEVVTPSSEPYTWQVIARNYFYERDSDAWEFTYQDGS